jgi:enamine deaminase RidA (YjgF/YER057c/UK114 family)
MYEEGVTMERKTINPWKWQDQLGFVQANSISGFQNVLICSGQTAMDEDGKPSHQGDMGAQLGMALDNLETVLRQAGYTLADIVRLNYYTTDIDAFFESYELVTTRLREARCKPASTLLGVQRLAFPELLVEIEATAAR